MLGDLWPVRNTFELVHVKKIWGMGKMPSDRRRYFIVQAKQFDKKLEAYVKKKLQEVKKK